MARLLPGRRRQAEQAALGRLNSRYASIQQRQPSSKARREVQRSDIKHRGCRQEEGEAAAPAAPGAARPGGVIKKKTAALPVSDFLDRCTHMSSLQRKLSPRLVPQSVVTWWQKTEQWGRWQSPWQPVSHRQDPCNAAQQCCTCSRTIGRCLGSVYVAAQCLPHARRGTVSGRAVLLQCNKRDGESEVDEPF